MEAIKNWSFHRKLQEKITSNSRSVQLPQKSIKYISILVDFQSDDEIDYLHRLIDELKTEGKIVKLLVYRRDKNPVDYLPYKAINSGHVAWDGVPSGSLVKEFLDRQYDVFFCAIRTYERPLIYLSTLCKAHLKVGTYHDDLESFFDILLHSSPEANISNIFDQFLTHLKIFAN